MDNFEETVRLYVSYGANPIMSLFASVRERRERQSRESLLERCRNFPLVRAFILADNPCLRLTDIAFHQLVGHYMACLFHRDGKRNSTELKACVIAACSVSWMRPLARTQLPMDRYGEISSILGTIAPCHKDYTRSICQWVAAVETLAPVTEHVQPIRCAYHHRQLHYIFPELLGAEEGALIRNFCSFDADSDMAVPEDFTVDPLDANAWASAWKSLPLQSKLRYFEFCAIVDRTRGNRRAVGDILAGVFALYRNGYYKGFLKQYIESLKISNGQDVGSFYNEALYDSQKLAGFINRAGLTCESVFTFLLAMYERSGSEGLFSPMGYVIERLTHVRVGAVPMIADGCHRYDVRYSLLAQAGVSSREFKAWAKAACQLGHNRLAAVISPCKFGSSYSTLRAIAAFLLWLTDKSLYAEYAGDDDFLRPHYSTKANAVADYVYRKTSGMLPANFSPAAIAADQYGYELREMDDGMVQWRPMQPSQEIVDEEAEWSASIPAVGFLSYLPMNARDRAFETICNYILTTTWPERWMILREPRSVSPYQNVPDYVIEAARVFDVEWVNPSDNYRVPQAIKADNIRPPWDLGCLDKDPIPYRRPPGGAPQDALSGDDLPQSHPVNVAAVLSGSCTLEDVQNGRGPAGPQPYQRRYQARSEPVQPDHQVAGPSSATNPPVNTQPSIELCRSRSVVPALIGIQYEGEDNLPPPAQSPVPEAEPSAEGNQDPPPSSGPDTQQTHRTRSQTLKRSSTTSALDAPSTPGTHVTTDAVSGARVSRPDTSKRSRL